ncbi:hypothetical protein [Janthinobacterium sp. 17J80-10]|uniref:hypothetical protein n=1 Tax=Janthinobacterium sp. 17J80-10 TaxID=2497863 RepID=UPI0010059918|nr:hypothetical protein [Janthinobacterium sp. 17J80-10]QAU33641.1 hypothetical protein EKL02_05270 [Janthinobacterium sp. 17J80-10]
MHSFTSSFERSPVEMPWSRILGIAVAVFLLFALGMEVRLAQIGVVANARDSQEKWEEERARANQLGEKALILIGASRIQLGVDLDILRTITGMEPVQLAIDGSTPMPVLAGLATDPEIRGTVIVDYYSHAIGDYGGLGKKYQAGFESHGAATRHRQASPYRQSEKFLTEWAQERMASYTDGASPLNSLLFRILDDDGARSLVTTRPDRSRLGDYTLVKMPEYYHRRVARTLGINLSSFNENTEASLAKQVSMTSQIDNAAFINDAARIRQLVSAIEARGGRVLFLEMPSSGMVRQVEEKRFPPEKFWKPFIDITGAKAVRSFDHPLLRDFSCPDGSHLDFRDRRKFTIAMAQALGLQRPGKAPLSP